MEGNDPFEWDHTSEVEIPKDPLSRVIGQDNAVELARRAARQRRHILLVGPPGIGKSMIAQAISFDLPYPEQEVQVVHNPGNPERPFTEILSKAEVSEREERSASGTGRLVRPQEIPLQAAEKLGLFCPRCETYSETSEIICQNCGSPKSRQTRSENPFQDLVGFFEITIGQMSGKGNQVRTTRTDPDGIEEVIVYEQAGDMVLVLDEEALNQRREMDESRPSKVLMSLERRTFIMATGASETELLGDVRHDPYGGHPGIGTPPYERVVPGAIHEAHEGVLYIDEVPHLGQLQRFILTAMQDKTFPISGRNPQSSGASVKVEDVPCDFILVAACNVNDLPAILSPLRSRIMGCGYEVGGDTTMPDSPGNRRSMVQFIAQEIQQDGRIPHADRSAMVGIVDEAVSRAKRIDNAVKAISLRLRDLGGLIRTAGDIAVSEGSDTIDGSHVSKALKISVPAEEQIRERYGSFRKGMASDLTESQRLTHPHHYWNESANPPGYE
jgi:ATP-dependent Lon protease